ncbi:MAG: patatin-like phospholipase family protein [Lachnospiraceae bacterium]|nr:patatin-like phospholipase family protein [Lachnospiraceae bacterium]
MKRAVVLCGGGTKGSYELGVWQALRELQIDYQIVTGTSIGSVNGAMMACRDYENAKFLWETIEMENVMEDGINLTNTIEGMYNQKELIRPFLKKYVKNKGADVSPFEKFIEDLIDEEKIRQSDVEYGLVTVQVSPMKPLELTLNEIPQGLLKEYIMCSSAIFPLFPMHKIENKTYIDGCYYDNLPIDFALRMGADEVIAVDLHTNPSHGEYLNKPFVTYIRPSRSLGTMMNFEREILDGNVLLGYQDAMKTFGKLTGFRYCFRKEELGEYEKQTEQFMAEILHKESDHKGKGGAFPKQSELKKICSCIEEHTNGKILTKEDYFVRGAEICGELWEIPVEPTYTMPEFIRRIREQAPVRKKPVSVKEEIAALFCKVCI